MAGERPFLGWLAVAFFGLGIPASLLMLLPNCTYLRLDREGFEMGSFISRHKYKWTDVADFRIASVSGAKMVAIAFHPEYNEQQLGRALAVKLGGIEAAIPNQYNATLEEIVEALATWRQRYGRQGGLPRVPTHGDIRASGGVLTGFPWQLLLLKVSALLSFCGGPLVVAGSLKMHMDKDVALAIAFAPTVALIFGVYSLWYGIHDAWDGVMVSVGGLGAVALLAMNLFAILDLANAPGRADAGLIQLGLAVGMVVVGFYAHASYKFFRQG